MNRTERSPDQRGAAASSVPLPGPIESDPTGVLADLAGHSDPDAVNPAGELARAMLDVAVHGLELGRYDRVILSWMKGFDQPTIATIASLLRRSWEAGMSAGRAEIEGEGLPEAGLRRALEIESHHRLELNAELVRLSAEVAAASDAVLREQERAGGMAEVMQRVGEMLAAAARTARAEVDGGVLGIVVAERLAAVVDLAVGGLGAGAMGEAPAGSCSAWCPQPVDHDGPCGPAGDDDDQADDDTAGGVR